MNLLGDERNAGVVLLAVYTMQPSISTSFEIEMALSNQHMIFKCVYIYIYIYLNCSPYSLSLTAKEYLSSGVGL
jgi:hypothetical protein